MGRHAGSSLAGEALLNVRRLVPAPATPAGTARHSRGAAARVVGGDLAVDEPLEGGVALDLVLAGNLLLLSGIQLRWGVMKRREGMSEVLVGCRNKRGWVGCRQGGGACGQTMIGTSGMGATACRT